MNRDRDLPGESQFSVAKVVVAIPVMSMIDLKEAVSLRYWCRLLGATPLEICRAVESVGSDPVAVRAHLKRRNAPIRLRVRRVRRSPCRQRARACRLLRPQSWECANAPGIFHRTGSFPETQVHSRLE